MRVLHGDVVARPEADDTVEIGKDGGSKHCFAEAAQRPQSPGRGKVTWI
jgi:hypothetical protein